MANTKEKCGAYPSRGSFITKLKNKARNILSVLKNERLDISPKEHDLALINYLNGRYEMLTDEQKAIFLDDIPEFDSKDITLRSLCGMLGIALPAKYESIADEHQSVVFRSSKVKPDDILIVIRSSKDFAATRLAGQYSEAIQKGAKLVIMSREEFASQGLDEETSPVILMDHSNERLYRFFSVIDKRYKAKRVMLTGSVGKTTTKDLCYTVARSQFDTYANENNTNTTSQVAKHLFDDLTEETEVFIHEAGAGYFGSVRLSASFMQPDILILTNVYGHHLQVYKTFDNLFADKVSGDDYLGKDGIIITNFDDENIRKHPFKHTVRSFAINNADADYRAINIKQYQEDLSFDIYEKETGLTTHVTTQILGEHNVYNILTAFVLGKVLGMSEENIRNALLEYRTKGVRQKLCNIGGVHFLLDCYNVAEESILAMLSAGERFDLEGNGKRIALIGGENKLGKNVRQRSRAFGARLADLKVDRYLFCGSTDRSGEGLNHFGDARSVKEGFQKASQIPCELSTSIADMVAFLDKHVERNDLVMVKGIYYLQMPIAVDKVFGTSFSFDLRHNKTSMKNIRFNGHRARLISDLGELELTAGPVVDSSLTIPDELLGYPVFRVKNNAFRGNTQIKQIFFGSSLKNIGASAFGGCPNIKDLTIPQNVKVIESYAFSNCTSLQKVILEEGVTHISQRAFSDCGALREIRIPASVGMIEENAFADCPDVSILCEENTFAHGYAIKHGLSFRLHEAG